MIQTTHSFEEKLFSAIHMLTSKTTTTSFPNQILYLLHLALLLISYITLDRVALIDQTLIFQNQYMALVMGALSALIALQLAISLLYLKEFYLLFQLSCFRLIIYHFLVRFLALEMKLPLYLPYYAALALFVAVVLAASSLSKHLVFESMKNKEIFGGENTITHYLGLS